MGVFLSRAFFSLIIGFSVGYAFAAAPNRHPANNSFHESKPFTSLEAVRGDQIYAETETFQVHSEKTSVVLEAMTKLGLSEDVDFAWMNKAPSAKILSFVCYSIECYHWAKKKLRTIAIAPPRPEESMGNQWHDASIDNKKERELTEDEKIKARQTLRYPSKQEG